jgi:signal recognition particle subunit SRP54
LVALDYHRPAAPEQLQQLGNQINVPVFIHPDKNPYEAAKEGLNKFAKYDTIIFDTAGRNALDAELASELKKLGELIKPDEVLLAVPADLGKVARIQSEEFNKLVGITGIFITKMDGTARAGGALAATSVTGAKVKFIGAGEKIEDFEVYNPERFVSRLLGLGDLQTLLEKAKEAEIEPEKAEKIIEGKFTLQDFYDQIEATQKMGPLSQIASMIPGMGTMKLPEGLMEKQEEKMKHYKHIMQSMTKGEKETPEIISVPRIKRIAKGSGRPESEVRELLQQYEQMKKMMKMLGGKAGLERGALGKLAKQLGLKL